MFLGSFFPLQLKILWLVWLEAVGGVKSQPHSYKNAEGSVSHILKQFLHRSCHTPPFCVAMGGREDKLAALEEKNGFIYMLQGTELKP